MISSSLTAASLLLLSLAGDALASPCIALDANWNLLAFGFGGKDWNAGTQDSWSSGSAKDITASGRPPFDGANTSCYLSQYTNAIYVMNGDAKDTSAVHIYDAAASSWSTQSVNKGDKFDPSSFKAILDHDTNVFYAVSKSEMFFLDMGLLKAANTSALSWTDVGATPLPSTYNPVMALAQNHIHFLNVPEVPAGSAKIFVIHFSWWQPDPQAYPGANGGNSFPASNGQVTSFFQTEGVQQEFAFIPSDNSATYVINVENNSTTTLPAPSTKDTGAQYFAGVNSLLQLDSAGKISYLPYKQGDASANSAAKWSPVAALASVAGASSPSSASSSGSSAAASGSATKGSASASKTGSATHSSASASGSASANNGAVSAQIKGGAVGVAAVALAFAFLA